jgi:hypothetical protein
VATSNFDSRTREEHESRLRNIVLHSADAMPDRVAGYIRDAREQDRWWAREQILKTFVPLVDHRPAEFVDFALGELIDGSEEEGWASVGWLSAVRITPRSMWPPRRTPQRKLNSVFRTEAR